MQAMVLCDRHMQTADARYGVFRFDQEWPNLLYTFRHAAHVSQTTTEYSQYVGALANSLMVYCFVRGLFDVGVSIMRAGAQAAERLGMLESAGSLLVQAVTLAQRAHNPAAMRAAVAELDRLSSVNLGPGLAGAAAMGRGDVALEESRLDDAEREFATAERSYRQAVDALEIAQGAANAAERQTDLIRMVAFAVKMQGFLHEQQKRSASAIECYERVVNLLEPSDDSLNIAATMHQLGNCYGDLRQYERSFRYYLEAAQRFHAIPVAEYLSNSLSEIGYVVINWDTAAPGLPAVSEELLCAGLEDLTEHLSVCVATSLDVPVELHGPILRKIFGMIALASFSEHRGCLEDWAYELRETILRPAIGDANQPVTANPIFWMHLDLMVAVAGSISGAPQVASGGASATLDEIRHLAFLAYKFYNWGWEAFRVFEWLAAYLARQRGVSQVDKDRLRTAAEAAADLRQPFTLD
jgi:tetratricopeptide (TPR) repeat protein